jgi:pimeloyl-ACP methyl ester carboxylesterase
MPDLRGHGLSEATKGVYLMDLLARDVKALLDHLGVGTIVLGGLSMGGYVAFAFYRLFRERVHGLILADTKAEADAPEAKLRREEQALSALRNGSGEIAGQLIGKMFTERTLKANLVLTERVRRMMENTSPVGVAGALRGVAERLDSTPLLPSIKVPTLVIVGEEDTITPVADARRVAGMIPGSELAVVQGAAHLSTLEKTEEVTGTIRRFLERIPKG